MATTFDKEQFARRINAIIKDTNEAFGRCQEEAVTHLSRQSLPTGSVVDQILNLQVDQLTRLRCASLYYEQAKRAVSDQESDGVYYCDPLSAINQLIESWQTTLLAGMTRSVTGCPFRLASEAASNAEAVHAINKIKLIAERCTTKA